MPAWFPVIVWMASVILAAIAAYYGARLKSDEKLADRPLRMEMSARFDGLESEMRRLVESNRDDLIGQLEHLETRLMVHLSRLSEVQHNYETRLRVVEVEVEVQKRLTFQRHSAAHSPQEES